MLRIVVIVAVEIAVVALLIVVFTGGDESERAGLGQLDLNTEGSVVTASISVREGSPALRELSIDWGDGTVEALPTQGAFRTFTVTAEHTYAERSSFVVLLVAEYADGRETTRSQTLDVRAAASPSVTSSRARGGAGSSATPAPTAAATAEATPEATATATPDTAATATPEPTATPTAAPTPASTPAPTPQPTPSQPPTPAPTPPAGNQPPSINILSLDSTGDPLTISLAVVVVDPEGGLAGIGIDWGDGVVDEAAPEAGPVLISHRYAAAGTYQVTVVALDLVGAEASASATATVGE